MKFPRVWGNGIPIKIATKSNTEKSGMTILYYLVDLALENSNPLTNHIVLCWKYSVEIKKIKKVYRYAHEWRKISMHLFVRSFVKEGIYPFTILA